MLVVSDKQRIDFTFAPILNLYNYQKYHDVCILSKNSKQEQLFSTAVVAINF